MPFRFRGTFGKITLFNETQRSTFCRLSLTAHCFENSVGQITNYLLLWFRSLKFHVMWAVTNSHVTAVSNLYPKSHSTGMLRFDFSSVKFCFPEVVLYRMSPKQVFLHIVPSLQKLFLWRTNIPKSGGRATLHMTPIPISFTLYKA